MREELERLLLSEDCSDRSREIINQMLDLLEEYEGEDYPDETEAEIDAMLNSITDEDILAMYDDDELVVIDELTGEVLDEDVQPINEILSRVERIRARVRFAKTKVKRGIKAKIAMKRRSSAGTINKRARKAAIAAMKMKIGKKPVSQMSVAEKERVERMIKKRKKTIDRLALKMAPRIRGIERDRMTK